MRGCGWSEDVRLLEQREQSLCVSRRRGGMECVERHRVDLKGGRVVVVVVFE
jgi:hypothetical protein